MRKEEVPMATQDSPNLYERLGGVYSIATVVDDLIDRVMADQRLNANPLVDDHTVPMAPEHSPVAATVREEPINVRYAGPNGLSANASPLLSWTQMRHYPAVGGCRSSMKTLRVEEKDGATTRGHFPHDARGKVAGR